MTLTVEVYGTCLADRASILRLADNRDYAALVTLAGNYSLVIRAPGITMLAASAFGPANLFYVYRAGDLFHGSRVLDVVPEARIDWKWNWRAVADLTALEHCVDDETLHADVRNLGPGMVIRCDAQGLSAWRMPWEERSLRVRPSFHRIEWRSRTHLLSGPRRGRSSDRYIRIAASEALVLAQKIAADLYQRRIAVAGRPVVAAVQPAAAGDTRSAVVRLYARFAVDRAGYFLHRITSVVLHTAGVDRLRAASFLVTMLHLTRAVKSNAEPTSAQEPATFRAAQSPP